MPLQHRLLHVEVRLGAVAISWYSTALYFGIALAPSAGAAARSVSVPAVAIGLSAAALVAFIAGYTSRTRSAD